MSSEPNILPSEPTPQGTTEWEIWMRHCIAIIFDVPVQLVGAIDVESTAVVLPEDQLLLPSPKQRDLS